MTSEAIGNRRRLLDLKQALGNPDGNNLSLTEFAGLG